MSFKIYGCEDRVSTLSAIKRNTSTWGDSIGAVEDNQAQIRHLQEMISRLLEVLESSNLTTKMQVYEIITGCDDKSMEVT